MVMTVVFGRNEASSSGIVEAWLGAGGICAFDEGKKGPGGR